MGFLTTLRVLAVSESGVEGLEAELPIAARSMEQHCHANGEAGVRAAKFIGSSICFRGMSAACREQSCRAATGKDNVSSTPLLT